MNILTKYCYKVNHGRILKESVPVVSEESTKFRIAMFGQQKKMYTAEEVLLQLELFDNDLTTNVDNPSQVDDVDFSIDEGNKDDIGDVLDLQHYELNSNFTSDGRKRCRKSNPVSWQNNINKRKRSLGEEYVGYKMVDGVLNKVPREARSMGPLCTKPSCINRKKRHCNQFHEDDGKKIFNDFWSGRTSSERDTFISSMVDIQKPKTVLAESSRRGFSRSYHLKLKGTRLEVCKDMFLNTLGISHIFVDRVLSLGCENVGLSTKPRNPNPSRGFKWNDEDVSTLAEFFEKIEKAPSHYCRKQSTMKRLFDIYKARCQALGKNHFSITKFTEYFKSNNFSLFQKKKDVCNACSAHEQGNLSDDEFKVHQKRKEDAFKLKQKDKDAADGIKNVTVTCDTEALLTAPHNNADIMFYRTKLNVHNFTFFDLNSKQVMNYLWSEVNGNITASNFTTCYIDYLTDLLDTKPNVETITIWSDSCGYQNKCHILASSLLNFSVKNNVTIFHKYLEVGHTHMECDSVHANIEKSLKNVNVNLPTDYINIIQSARKNSSGRYQVKYLNYKDFKNYADVSDIKSIKPSSHVGGPLVKDIRQMAYYPDGQLFFNLTYDESNWEIHPQKYTLEDRKPAQLYERPLPIKESKWKHLQEIKITIPQDCHYFYDNLDHV